jgi:hypothetical protein
MELYIEMLTIIKALLCHLGSTGLETLATQIQIQFLCHDFLAIWGSIQER